MDIFWQELTSGLPDTQQLTRVIIRLIAAALPGSIIGYERERAGKAAGLRTHILVTLGTCVLFSRVRVSGCLRTAYRASFKESLPESVLSAPALFSN